MQHVHVEGLESRQLFAVVPAAFPFEAGGSGFDAAERVAVDAAGNVIVAGVFSGSTDFNPSRKFDTVLTARGDTDGFVAKYSPAGALLWVKQFGGTYTDDELEDFDDRDPIINPRRLASSVGRVGDQPRALGEYVGDVAVGPDGDVYLTGSFRETAFFGKVNGKAVSFATSDDDYHDAFVMRIDGVSGKTQWANRYGGRFDDVGMGIDVDAAGNAVVGGYFSRDADFGAGRSSFVVTALGRDDAFVMQLSGAGKLVWLNQIGGESVGPDDRDAANDVGYDAAGNVYAVGTFSDRADFAPGPAEFELESEGGTDAWTALYSARGKFVWAGATGGEDNDGNAALAVGPNGDVFTAGYFNDEFDVDPGPGEVHYEAFEEDEEGSGFTDVVLSRLNRDGTLNYAAQLGGNFYETIGSLAVGPDNSVYLAGGYFETIDLDPGRGQTLVSSTLTADGDDIDDNNQRFNREDSYDVFAVRLSARGKYLAGGSFGGAGDDFGAGLALSGGNVILTGRFVGTAAFGAATLTSARDEAGFFVATDLLFDVV